MLTEEQKNFESVTEPDVDIQGVRGLLRSGFKLGVAGAKAIGKYGSKAMSEYTAERAADVAKRSEELGQTAVKKLKEGLK